MMAICFAKFTRILAREAIDECGDFASMKHALRHGSNRQDSATPLSYDNLEKLVEEGSSFRFDLVALIIALVVDPVVIPCNQSLFHQPPQLSLEDMRGP